MEYSPASIIAVSVVLPVLALVAICLRFWVRLRVHPTYIGIDDWLILGAFVFLLGDAANLIVPTVLGIQGQDYPGAIPPDRAAVEEKSDHAQVIIEKPLYALFKLSFLFFYRRIFKVQPSFRKFNDIIIVFIIVWALAFMFAEIGICGGQPTVLWDPESEASSCSNHKYLDFAFSITDVIGDILVIIMPFPYIRKLKINLREKLAISSIFMLGALSTAACIVRLYFVSMAVSADQKSSASHNTGTPPAIWSGIEGSVGVLAACLPPLGPLIRKSPNPKKMSVSFYHRFLTRSSGYSEDASSLDHNNSHVTRPSETLHREKEETLAEMV